MRSLLLLSVFVISTCGLVYELIAGALASYLLGDSVTQFSTVIGCYLFSMGVGSFLSKFARRNLLGIFIQVELMVGLFGGFSAAILFLLFDHVGSFRLLLYSLVALIGMLVGLEIPILMRILREKSAFKDLVADVFAFDYVGALIASLLFPLVLVPHLGMVRSAILFGLINTSVGIVSLIKLGAETTWSKYLKFESAVVLVLLVLGFVFSEKLISFAEASNYADPIVFAKSTPYQRIVLTRSNGDLRLFLNGNLQFSSRDEYRYHEALVHPAMISQPNPRSILVLGGGDGLAVRELLKYPSVEKIVLVDLDPEMTRLFSNREELKILNAGSLKDPKVTVINGDAFVWADKSLADLKFDVAIVDFPDPSNFSIGKLYTTRFYAALQKHLRLDSVVVVQSTSPYVARKSFWCVDKTLRAAGFITQPYHVYVPAFGDWGYVMASQAPIHSDPKRLVTGLKFLTPDVLQGLFNFPPDMGPVETQTQKLNNQVLVRYFEQEWAHYVH